MIDLILLAGGIALGGVFLAGVVLIAFYAIWMSSGSH